MKEKTEQQSVKDTNDFTCIYMRADIRRNVELNRTHIAYRDYDLFDVTNASKYL